MISFFRSRSREIRTVNLALQGGGAMGAFTWGVLDRMLEEDRLAFDGISGTSAGAMNAVVLAHGLANGGRDAARTALADFWNAVSRDSPTSPLRRSLIDRLMGGWRMPVAFEYSPAFFWLGALPQYFSPYEFNPLNINPLRDLLEERVDFEMLQKASPVRLFVAATNVQTGRIKIFSEAEVTADAVMASACLPLLFHAVEIDGVPYWDGGYMGNPALFPLFQKTRTADCILVQINPIERRETPRTVRQIEDRLTEITFNGTLLRELRAVHFVSSLIDSGRLSGKGTMRVRMHRVDAEEALKEFNASERMNTDRVFLERLRDIGREATDQWLSRHFNDLGSRSTLNLEEICV